MSDSGKIAGVVVLVGVLGLGVAGWFVLNSGDATDAELGQAATPEATADAPGTPTVLPESTAAIPQMPADAEPGSLEGRIADLQAQLRDEQTAALQESQRLGAEIQALRETIGSLEADIQALDDGKLARLDAREGKQGDRCDPAEPDSRACKRQAALQAKLGDATADRGAMEAELAAAQEQEQALMDQRTAALRLVDELAERQRSDPELVSLYQQLARGQ